MRPLAATSVTNGTRTPSSTPHKQMFQSMGLFCKKAGRPHPLVIDKRGTDNVVLTDRAIRASRTKRPVLTGNSSTRNQNNKGLEAIHNPHNAYKVQQKLKRPNRVPPLQNVLLKESLALSAKATIFGTSSSGIGMAQAMTYLIPPKHISQSFVARY